MYMQLIGKRVIENLITSKSDSNHWAINQHAAISQDTANEQHGARAIP